MPKKYVVYRNFEIPDAYIREAYRPITELTQSPPGYQPVFESEEYLVAEQILSAIFRQESVESYHE